MNELLPDRRGRQKDRHCPSARIANRALVAEALGDEVVAEIRAYLQQQKALGSDRFQEWVATRTGKFAGLRRPGRPSAKANFP